MWSWRNELVVQTIMWGAFGFFMLGYKICEGLK